MRSAFPRLSLLLVLAAAAGAQTQGTISEVRVYRGQALVTRNVPFDAKAGAQELVVSGLPPQVLPETLYATGDGNLVIRAVRLRTTAVQDAPNEEVRKLDGQIKSVNDQLRRVASDLLIVETQTKYLDKLEAFVAPTAQAELTKGVLNAEALMSLTKFSFEQRQQLATQKLTLEGTQDDAKEQLAVLTRERAKLAGEAQHTARDAVVFLEARQAGAAKLDLSYLVAGVSWAPAYIARLNDGHEKLALEYHAVVAQMSGEDWPDVALTLSTSNPTTVADPPVLAPLYIALAATEQAEDADKAEAAKDYALRRRALEEQIRQAPAQNRPADARRGERSRAGAAGPAGRPAAPGEPMMPGGGGLGGAASLPVTGDAEGLMEANVLAAQLQNLELSASDEALRTAKRMGSDSAGLTADYAMPGKVTLQSRADPQMLRIATLDLDATFYYTAVPLLSDYIYQAVEAVNNTDYPLLPGPYNAYVGASFAGRGDLPLTARGQSLRVGFGTETQLRVSRELKAKQTEIKGGNKVITYTYEMRLQNFREKPSKVRLWDRLPQPPDKQVSVTLQEPGQPLSTDAWYTEQEKPRGLLRWDLEVPAKAVRTTALAFTYKFQLEFDKNFSIGELPPEAVERLKRDFEMMKPGGMGGGFGGAAQP